MSTRFQSDLKFIWRISVKQLQCNANLLLKDEALKTILR